MINARATVLLRNMLMALSLSLVALPVSAQSEPTVEKSAEKADAPAPAEAAPQKNARDPSPAADRGFTPSEEVSPDQEVDFPADI